MFPGLQNGQCSEDETDGKISFLNVLVSCQGDHQRRCRHLDIRIVFRSGNTLHNSLVKVKPATPMVKTQGVVYEILCLDCDKIYIGETRSSLQKRLYEHRQAVKKADRNNGIAVHA